MDSTREQDLKDFYKNDEYKINLHKEHLDGCIYNYWQYIPSKKLEDCLDLLSDEDDAFIFCKMEGLILCDEGETYPTLMDKDDVAFEFRYREITIEQFYRLLEEFALEYYDLSDKSFYIEVKDISEGSVTFETHVEDGEDILKSRMFIGDIVIGVTGNKHLMM